jgi:predicted CoA-substrate-specific enzyme activase
MQTHEPFRCFRLMKQQSRRALDRMVSKGDVRILSMGKSTQYRAGLDIGSTTAKLVLLNREDDVVFSDYLRHHAQVYHTARSFLENIEKEFGNICLGIKLTGSAALGVSKQLKLPFVQEMIATHTIVSRQYPDVRTIMDIGGEDSKIIFLRENQVPDIRMNGSCAGGTGSFIDQVATLLGITPFQLNELAGEYRHIYPVASRCGVFAKTDIQNMLSRNISHADIAASVFHAMAVQCINSLARGISITPQVVLCGGVFSFLPELVKAFVRVLEFDASDMVLPRRPELMTAGGAAFSVKTCDEPIPIHDLIRRMDEQIARPAPSRNRLNPLFESPAEFAGWRDASPPKSLPKGDLSSYQGGSLFLGIDSGSTTTKIVVIGEEGQILFSWYADNGGNPVGEVFRGLEVFREKVQESGCAPVCISRSAVTGYGEDLIRTAFNLDMGIVETIAHYMAARFVDPEVSFILDIGGQDMKAMFVDQGIISRIELNEACSSGCGSFLQTLAASVRTDIASFAGMACQARSPCDLGTRCTVFMNSKIKQSLRENASIADISAGLSYSVIKNCLFKVLKLRDMAEMGDHIVLQGGTFKNPSIVRAMELISGKKVSVSAMPEMMGAFGAALSALERWQQAPDQKTRFPGLDRIERMKAFKARQIPCKGCENTCMVTRFDFSGNRVFYSGNKCETVFSAKGETAERGFDFTAFKRDLIFNRPLAPHAHPILTLGIPRVLNFFDNFVFWHALFTGCGINVVLSGPSTTALSEKGMGTVMSDNICFPAKLVHGHIFDLIEQQADRIFFPVIMYERQEFEKAVNSYNCPIVSSYPDVIESAVQPGKNHQVPLDRPVFTFHDTELLKKKCIAYLKQFDIPIGKVKQAFETALSEQEAWIEAIRKKARQIIRSSREKGSLLIVLAGRPYHVDSLINHKIPEVLTRFGVDIITEDAVSRQLPGELKDVRVVTQWAYPNRIYRAAQWVAKQGNNVHLVQLNSFGCGPDAVVVDEVKQILETGGKNHTLIRVDEICSPGSVRLRLRSLIESLKQSRDRQYAKKTSRRKPFRSFFEKDRRRTIWAPYFSEDYSAYLPALFKNAGYQFETLPKPDRESVETGLRYANHDICYPGTIVIGDIIKALKTRQFNPKDVAIGITQTGGQCRASNYLALIHKAMIAAGFDDIPVISVTLSQGLVRQPGFKVNWLKKIRLLYLTTMFADCVAKMYYATACREKAAGISRKLRQLYMKKVGRLIERNDNRGIYRLLEKAVRDFNSVPVDKRQRPRMGVVGEIYAKYNYFSNQDLAHWLIRQGVEPVLPPIVDYFIQDLVNFRENIKAGIRKNKLSDLLGIPIKWFILGSHKKVNTLFSQFRFFSPFEDIRHVAGLARRVVSMTNQFGEGWLIPGEIAAFARQGVNHVLSLQPFGCIANHIVSKGVEKKLRQEYPDLNLYFLDFDPGMSEANVRNRLHFMVEQMDRI